MGHKPAVVFRRGDTRQEFFWRAGFRMGHKAAVRALSEELARRDRELAQIREQFERDIDDLRAELNQAREAFVYLQKLDRAMRELPWATLQ
jgi:hypothetical protein